MAEGGSVSGMVGAPSSADGDGARATSFIERAILRRRLRFLQRRRELALHDLGGFVFEAHRQGEVREELTGEKLAAIAAIDAELETLQRALDVREELTVLREPGVASCPQCGTIHDSGANYCPSCGRPAAATDR
jgi:rubrerythrin